MARTLTAAAQAEIAKKLGTEPINIIQIEWVDGTVTQYADKTTQGIPGKILEISNLDEILNLTQSTTTASVNVRLDDSDGSIKALMDTYDIHKRPCKILQYFEGLSINDAFLVFDGEVSSPIRWAAYQKEVVFEVLSAVNSVEVGFTPESGQFQYVNDELVGKNWPLVFGSCIHVPAQKAQETLIGQTMNYFGLIDVTLQPKINTLKKVATKLEYEYAYLKSVIDIITSLGSPRQMQSDYVDAILTEDAKKQEAEDKRLIYEEIEKRLDKLKKLWQLATTKTKKNEIKNQIDDLEADKKIKADVLKKLNDDLERLNKTKFLLEYKGDVYEYLFEIGNDLKEYMRELIVEYVSVQDQITTLGLALIEQSQTLTRYVTVTNGEDFPQNVNLNVLINDVNFRGYFSGKTFNIGAVYPTNVNVGLTGPTTNEKNAIWLQDANIKLDNHYCLMNTGHIIKITEQQDDRCRFTLIQKRGVETFTDDTEIEITGANADQIRDAMENYLSGDETDAQLQAIVNRAPRTIAKNIWKTLSGGTEEQTLELHGNVDGGYFKLVYDEWTTQTIPWNATAEKVRQRLENLPIFNSFKDTTKWEFTGGPINESKITIKFNTDKWVDDDDPIPAMMLPLTVINDFLSFDDSDPDNRVPWISAYRKTTGAMEYTLLERTSLLEQVMEEDPDYEVYAEMKAKTQALLNKYYDAAKNGGSVQAKHKLANSVFENFDKMLEQQQAVGDQAVSPYDEAFRMISDDEFAFLYKMELANYFAMVQGLTELQVELEGDEEQDYYFTGSSFIRILETSPVILPQWITTLEQGTDNEVIEKVLQLPDTKSFIAQTGTDVKLNALGQEKYVANIVPSTVHAVYAKRNIEDIVRLVPVPTNKYTKYESDNVGFLTTTTIVLHKPLSEYPAENWVDDDIYVTMTSSVGPNIADIIAWILTTFTNASYDSTSFTDVWSKVANYPANFALFDKKDALQLIKDIAWQSRCAVWIKNKVAYIRYLSEDPTPVATLTDTDIEEETLQLELTETEDIVTKFTATWLTDYYRTENIKTIVRHNLSRYGEQEQTFDFYIYNIWSLVMKSATFWAYRYANTWKRVTLTTFLTNLEIETFDAVTIDLTTDYFSTGPITGIVEKAEYDSAGSTVRLTIWLPVKAGEMTKSDFAFPSSVSIDTVFPETDVVLAGNAGDPIGQLVPTGIQLNPLASDFTDKRPPDLGAYKPSDQAYALPTNPTADFNEVQVVQYKAPTAKQLKIQQYHQKMYKQRHKPNPLKKPLNKTQKALGKPAQPTYTGVGKVIGKNEDKSTTIDADVNIADSDNQHQFYDVELSNGEVVPVKQMLIDPDAEIPKGTRTMVVYDDHQKEYQMQVPVYMTDEIAEV